MDSDGPHQPRETPRSRHRALLELAFWLGVMAVSAVTVMVVPRPRSQLWQDTFNCTHVLLSTCITLVALRVSRRLVAPERAHRLYHYGVAAAVSTLLGVGLEVAQAWGPGDASLTDLGRDALGTLAALAWAWAGARRAPRAGADDDPTPLAGSRVRRGALRLLALTVLALGLSSPLWTFAALTYRGMEFPVLASFDSRLDRHFVSAGGGATVAFVPPPAAFASGTGSRVARVRFGPGKYPRLVLAELAGDWSRYESLRFEVYSPATAAVELDLRIHDAQHRSAYADRFNDSFTIPPGRTTVTIPVARIRAAPAGRSMDLARVAALMVFVRNPPREVTLYFDGFRLD